MTGEGAPRPALAPEIKVAPGIDIDSLWDRFEIFEAMHHSQRVCNPMRDQELSRILDLIEPSPSRSLLDVGCGSGELLIRCHERGATSSTGVDLSPWMLASAQREARRRLSGPQPQWMLGDAARLSPLPVADVAICVGAEWVWHGMEGTIAALVSQTTTGGLLVYGGPRLHFDADPDETTRLFGRLDTIASVEKCLERHGCTLRERVDPGEAGWRAYLERGRGAAHEWRRRHPGPRADRYVDEQHEWAERYEAECHIVGWSVWIAEVVNSAAARA